CQWVREAGHEVFLDQDPPDGIAVGELWRQRVWGGVRWADAVICVVASAYLVSILCAAEIAVGQSRGRWVLALRMVAQVGPPLLSEVQYSDMTTESVAARATVAGALRRIDVAGGAGWPDDLSPFPGLRPFDIDQHQVFFGRTEETKHLAELLRSTTHGSGLLAV